MDSRLTLGVLFLLTGCEAAAPATASVSTTRSSLEGAFEQAAREYQVPVELLKGIAWVETRVSQSANLESATGGLGLMQLTEREDWTLQSRAMALTGVSRGQLAVDPAANVRGAAAVLRELFDRTQRDEPSLDARQAGDWYRAVSLYMGFTSADAAHEWAADVYRAIAKGFTASQPDGVVVQAPTWTAWERHAPAFQTRRDGLGDYPGRATYVQSPNHTNGRSTYEFVVIHTMQGSYSGSRSWFLNTSSNVSSHYLVRSSDGEITQMVEHADTAWHAQCYNARSIGIEHEGYVQDPARWYTDAMYTESAKLTRYICDRHGIPKDRVHVIGHVEVAPGCNTGRHTDPGSGWNWTRYMSLVTGAGPTPTTGTLIGVIYQGGSSSNRVAGAVVTVNGQSVTTGADGLYQFQLAPGSYTANVTKSGYGTNTVTRSVTSSTQIWGSMEINPAQPQNGTLAGKVFVFNPANPGDVSQPVAGASVVVTGQTVTTSASGDYSLSLPPGTYTVTVTKAGYQQAQASRAVTAGQTATANVGLTSTTTPDTRAPEVVVNAPALGARLDVAMVQVRGTASDDRGAVAEVRVSLNGGAEQPVPVTTGAWQVELKLAPGTNTLVVKARDGANNEGTATVSAVFLAGVAGVVTKAGDGAQVLAGATLELRESSSGAVVSTATTDADGRYELAVGAVPADYTLVVRAAGHVTSSETVSVPDNRRLTVNVALTPGQMSGGEATLRFLEPLDGAEVMTDSVTLYGQVAGFDVATVTVNGAVAELVGAGGFSATVPLQRGANVIEAVAQGISGESVSGRLTVTWNGQHATVPTKSLVAEPVVGGCSSGAGLAPLLTLALLLRRRSRR
ncbi:MAG: carboxypeptidase regulatory-like domain-containing protein [Myxococcaceae bacterium]|nr:carboxypeptidase regulatory-like domain-containing protein [Myxococcaceae bacterium]